MTAPDAQPGHEEAVTWWEGVVHPVFDHYELGRPRIRNLDDADVSDGLAIGLAASRSGVVMFPTTRHVSDVRLTVRQGQDQPGADGPGADRPVAPGEAAAFAGPERPDQSRSYDQASGQAPDQVTVTVTVAKSGWVLRTFDGEVPGAPGPLLGVGTWRLRLERAVLDVAGGIEAHTLTCTPVRQPNDQTQDSEHRQATSQATSRGVNPAAGFTPPPPRSKAPRSIRWRPAAGTYVVVVRRGDTGGTAEPAPADVESVVQGRQGEWDLDPAVKRFSSLGEKWILRREWVLAAGDSVAVANEDGTAVAHVPDPFASGPARVRLCEQDPEVGDFVDAGDGRGARLVLPHEDGLRLEVWPT